VPVRLHPQSGVQGALTPSAAPSLTYDRAVPLALIVARVVFVVLAFLLAFTIFGEISGVLGLVCIAVGTVMVSEREPGPRTD
jgi:hypothetical protein